MKISWLIALRELAERIKTRSFISMAIVGPILVLLITYILFVVGEKNKPSWKVLIADPTQIMENKILSNTTGSIKYDFINSYVQLKDFENGKKYEKYDALLEVNEKVLSNKVGYLFYREKPSLSFATSVQFHLERRLEEVLITRFTKMTIKEFRRIKQPISLGLRNIYDPKNESFNLSGWVGFFFGGVILFFILLFGMTILRSISIEKSNRIVEVLLASVKPRQLMLGKITGIGLAALIQFLIWVVVIALGLLIMREILFKDMMDASNWNVTQMTQSLKNQTISERLMHVNSYNDFVELVFERIKYGNMLFYFMLFFCAGYLFYGTFFAALGATSGSENDGQQFVIPIVIVLFVALWAGYYVLLNPESSLTYWFSFIPFTAPMVSMVRLAQGYSPGEGYQLFLSFFLLVLSSLFMLRIAGRLYTNGILQFGHRLKLSQFIKWIQNG